MVAMARRIVGVGLAGLLLGGCAGQSGYSVDVRNNTGEMVKLELMQASKKDEPKMVETAKVSPGANGRIYTKADRDALVTLQARIDGDAASDPALKRLTIGLTELAISPAPKAKDLPPKAPKLVIKERRD